MYRLLAVVGLVSCGAELDPVLADMARWQPATGADPLAAHRPVGASCASGAELEALTFEIDTELCAYAFFEQPLGQALEPGARVVVGLWHADLAAAEPATGHVALLADGAVIWERTVPIPSPACVYDDVVEVEAPIERGTPLQLHLHNHGANTWNLRRVERAPDRDPGLTPGCAK